MSKYRIHLLLFATAAAFLLGSCEKESVPGGIPMQVEPSLQGDTKGSMTGADLKDFYLRVEDADPSFSYFEHLSWNDGWTSPSPLFWKNKTATVSFCAAHFGDYAFTATDFDDSAQLAVPLDQSTQELLNAADLLSYPEQNVAYTTSPVPITFHHALAMVSVVIILDPSFYGCGFGHEVTSCIVEGTDTGFLFAPETGAVIPVGDTKQDVAAFRSSYQLGSSTSSTYVYFEAILVPQHFEAGDLRVQIRVGAWEYKWSNPAAFDLSSDKISSIPISISTLPEVDRRINGHEYVEMGEGLGLRWATCNVGAANPENYGDYFAWGETASKANFYDWSTYSFGSGSSFTRYTGNDYSTLLPEDDAARHNWGSTWRIPTREEWKALATEDFIWSETDYSGTHGILVTSIVPGYEGNMIFLPAGGHKLSDVYISSLSERPYYWASSLVDIDASSARALQYYSLPSFGGVQRFWGLSVRPVSN